MLDSGRSGSDSYWNTFVFDTIRQKFGGRVRLIVTGAAPITKEVFQFLQICFSCVVSQGYGLTESCACCTITHPENIASGHTGGPQLCCEIRLADVPDMKASNSHTCTSHLCSICPPTSHVREEKYAFVDLLSSKDTSRLKNKRTE